MPDERWEAMARDVAQLKTVVFGAPGVRSLVERIDGIEGKIGGMEDKIDTLLDGQAQRETDWMSMRAFLAQERDRQAVLKAIQRHLGIAAAVLSATATLLGIVGGLVALGVIKL